jgi:cyclopropane fatty-acyl-phospholipid synthase-like methyltransferase
MARGQSDFAIGFKDCSSIFFLYGFFQIVTIADVGCGGGDLLRAVHDWAQENRLNVELIGIDANPFMTRYSIEKSQAFERIRFQTMNVLSESFRAMRFDIICINTFCHHFADAELVQLLKQLRTQVSTALIINDLQRHRFAYFAIKWISRIFRFSYLAQNDGPISVLRAFSKIRADRIHPTGEFQSLSHLLALGFSLGGYIMEKIRTDRPLIEDRIKITREIANFWDKTSLGWKTVWGPHIHHGYFEHHDETPVEAQEKLLEKILEMLQISSQHKVLDVGCGMGGSSLYLAKRYGATVTGITLSQKQVDMAKQQAQFENIKNVSFQVEDALSMESFADNSFDLVWSLESCEQFFDKQMLSIKPFGS